MNDSEHLVIEKGLLHDPNAPNGCDIVGTTTDTNSRDSEVCVCVFALCNAEACFAELFESKDFKG